MDHIARPQHRLIQNIDHLQDQFHRGHDFQKFTDPSPIQSHQLTIQEILFRHFKINHIQNESTDFVFRQKTQSFAQSLFQVVLSYRGTRIDTVRIIIGEKSQ